VLVAVSFDPHGVQDCTIDIWPALFGLPEGTQMVMQDLMLDQTTIFELGLNRLSLDPNFMPFAIWRARRSESP
jgi:hypothetical protein